MNSMVRERDTHVSRLFIEVTPGIRRALELLAEASITLLDEIDSPVDGLEADPDFEITFEDDEDGGDDEAEPAEPDLGWTEDGQIAAGEGWEGMGSDEDFADPETSAGFPRGEGLPYEARAAQKALFDPRIERRGQVASIHTTPTGHQIGTAAIPRFPHEPTGRARFYVDDEIRRLSMHLAKSRRRARRAGTNRVSKT